MGFKSQQHPVSGTSLLKTAVGGEETKIAINVNNLGDSEEEMSNSSSSSLAVSDMETTEKQQNCIAVTTQCPDRATAIPPATGFQRLVGHYTRTASIMTDITTDDDNSPHTNLDIEEEKNIVCHRCNGLVAGPFFSTCQCPVPLLENNKPAAARSTTSRGGLNTLLRKISSTVVHGGKIRCKVTAS